METSITIIIANYNTADFVRLSLFALARLTHANYKVLICDNGSNEQEKEKLKKEVAKYDNVGAFFRQQQTHGSIGNAEALNILIEKIDTPYGAMIDADASFLIKDWDKLLLDMFTDKIKIVGSPRGTSGSARNSLGPYLTIFDVSIFKSLKINMMPGVIEDGQDVGWEMSEKFSRSSYQAIMLEARNTRTYRLGPFSKIICMEFYLQGIEHIFGSHFSRGATLGTRKYTKSWQTYLYSTPLLGEYLSKKKGKAEKRHWIAISKDIVNKQR